MVLGYASVGARPTTLLLVLLAVGLAFHVVAFALNDIFDLDIDRTNPDRARSPLVSGRVSVTQSSLIIAGIAAASLLIDIGGLGFKAAPLAALLAGYACLAAYDVYTKRTPWPILTDAVQGVGWACLLAYAALRASDSAVSPVRAASAASLTGTTPFAGTAVVGTFVFLFVVLVNGVHGGLRDLANDATHGTRTTAMVLGARLTPTASTDSTDPTDSTDSPNPTGSTDPTESTDPTSSTGSTDPTESTHPTNPTGPPGAVAVPALLRRYAWGLQLAMALVAVVAIGTVPARTVSTLTWYAAAVGFSLVALATQWQAFRVCADPTRFRHLGATHILVCYVPVMCLAAMYAGPALGAATAAVMFLPMLGNSAFRAAFAATPSIVRATVRRTRSARRLARTPAPAPAPPPRRRHGDHV